MFAVPGPERLRVWIGSTAFGLPACGVCEVAEDERGRSVTFQVPKQRRYDRLSVRQARRGTAKVHIEVARYPSRIHANTVELATYAGVDRWLRGIRDVAEDRRPAPSGLISAEVLALCLRVPPRPKDWISVTEAAVIDAEPDAVWAEVHPPHFHPETQHTAVACGFVPGTPVGQAGEIQYFIQRLADGVLSSGAVAVSARPDSLSAVSHQVAPPYAQTRYRVCPENGQARLELTWTGPPGAGGASREWMANYLRAQLQHHKAVLEGTAGHGG